MPLKLNSSGGGSVTLDVPSTGSALTVTVPAITDTIVTRTASETLTNKTFTSPTIDTPTINSPTINTPTMGGTTLTAMTAKAFNWNGLTTNTVLEFTGIPSWVERITIVFSGLSTSGTSFPIIQIGSGSFTTSGYASTGGNSPNAAAPGVSTGTVGFILEGGTAMSVATATRAGRATLYNITGNTWVLDSLTANTASTQLGYSAGTITLGGVLDRVRVNTVNGTDIIDAGTVNVFYE